jgi:hypothetical protein
MTATLTGFGEAPPSTISKSNMNFDPFNMSRTEDVKEDDRSSVDSKKYRKKRAG